MIYSVRKGGRIFFFSFPLFFSSFNSFSILLTPFTLLLSHRKNSYSRSPFFFPLYAVPLVRSNAAYLPSSPPRAVYIRVGWPRLPIYRLGANRGNEPIAVLDTPLPPTTSSLPTRMVCGQCLTVNCANSAELGRGQGFRRWPMSRRAEDGGGERSRD